MIAFLICVLFSTQVIQINCWHECILHYLKEKQDNRYHIQVHHCSSMTHSSCVNYMKDYPSKVMCKDDAFVYLDDSKFIPGIGRYKPCSVNQYITSWQQWVSWFDTYDEAKKYYDEIGGHVKLVCPSRSIRKGHDPYLEQITEFI